MSSEGLKGIAPVNAEDFKHACGRFATGIAIAGVMDANGAPHGLTISSFASVSLLPPLVSICLGHAVTSIGLFRGARFFSLSVLGAGQREISQLFARKNEDRFEGLEWHCGEYGAPLVANALAEIECAARQIVTAGDHDILIGEVVAARYQTGAPLIHFASRYRQLAPLDGE
jgi:flavin reductase (DIM6/NTAB) family NADH-FMN oxidoreductase RutF